jgi:peptidoglycan hydrolase-like protein with peptidoglycan-binding domain
MVARLVDHAFENPATSGGLLVMALTASAIVSNAMFLQAGRGPDPLFGATAASRPVHASPVTASDTGALRSFDEAPLPHLSPVPRTTVAAVAPSVPPAIVSAEPATIKTAVADETALITDIQRELAKLGLYTGAIDGTSGPRTSKAIAAYEVAAGLRPTGQPSQRLLDALRQPIATPQRRGEIRALVADPVAAQLDARERDRAAAIADARQAQDQIRLHESLRLVQNALNRTGYGPVAVTGDADAETADAIRRFELDNGLPVTGEVGDALLGRLVAIGAVRPG